MNTCKYFFSNLLETPAERLLLNGCQKELEVETLNFCFLEIYWSEHELMASEVKP